MVATTQQDRSSAALEHVTGPERRARRNGARRVARPRYQALAMLRIAFTIAPPTTLCGIAL